MIRAGKNKTLNVQISWADGGKSATGDYYIYVTAHTDAEYEHKVSVEKVASLTKLGKKGVKND